MHWGYPRTLVEPPEGSAPTPESLPKIGLAVHAVIVAHDPGEWFIETLRSLRDQDYSALSVTVVDVPRDRAGAEEVAASTVMERVAAVLPDATVMTLAGNPGFAPAANAAARMIMVEAPVADGTNIAKPSDAAGHPEESSPPGDPRGADAAAFLLICHDDVALAPDAVARLVDEAVRRDAAVVGPKLVDWDNPDFLQAVGLSADRMGVAIPVVSPGEYDQGQHDAPSEVLAVPSACMLIRSEIFERLDGFDDAMTYHGEDLDLGRRANLHGETVVVAPGALVRHRGRLEQRRRRADRELLSCRHGLRSTLVCSAGGRIVAEVPVLLALTLLEAFLALITGHFRRSAALLGAWPWNLLGLSEVMRRRRSLAGRSGDARVHRLQHPGYVSLTRFVGRLVRGADSADAAGSGWGRPRRLADSLRVTSTRTAAVGWVVVMAVFLFGGRHLLTRSVPVIGEIAILGDSPAELFRAWFSTWREAGLGSDGPAPTAFGILGVAGSLLFGAMGLTRTVLLLGLVPFGALGLWRLLAPTGNRRVQIVGLVAFVAMPLPYNALANGVWSALALYGTLPWVCLWLARVVGPPTARHPGAVGTAGGGFWLPTVMVGILLGLLGAFVPVAPLAVVMLAVALAIGGLLAGEGRRLLLLSGAVIGGLLIGWLLNWPSAPGSPEGLLGFNGARPAGAGDLSVAELLRFATGSAAGGHLVWGLPAAGAVALVVARGDRFTWALRAWSLVVLSVTAGVAAEHGWGGWEFPRPEVLLAPAAFGLALAIALGAAGVSLDVPARAMGRRFLLAGVGLVALVAGSVPVLALTLDGRWGMPRGDITAPLAEVESESERGAFRILWVGHPDVLPLRGWTLDEHLVFATSTAAVPDLGLQWPGRQPPAADQLRSVWRDAVSGATDRMGERLAPLGVRYVIVMERIAPEPFGDIVEPVPAVVTERLAAQFDLDRQESRGGLAVYRNTAWRPTRALLEGTGPVTPGRIAASTTLALPEFEPPTTARGPLPAGSTLYLADGAGDWVLRVNGRPVRSEAALGWAQSFPVDADGTAVLSHEPSSAGRWSIVSQIVLWAIVLVLTPLVCLRRRSVAIPQGRPGDDSAEPPADNAEEY